MKCCFNGYWFLLHPFFIHDSVQLPRNPACYMTQFQEAKMQYNFPLASKTWALRQCSAYPICPRQFFKKLHLAPCICSQLSFPIWYLLGNRFPLFCLRKDRLEVYACACVRASGFCFLGPPSRPEGFTHTISSAVDFYRGYLFDHSPASWIE